MKFDVPPPYMAAELKAVCFNRESTMAHPTDPPKGAASRLTRELQASPIQRVAREFANSLTAGPARKLAVEFTQRPNAKLARDLAELSTAKLARELSNAPIAKLGLELAEWPTAKLVRELAELPTARLTTDIIKIHKAHTDFGFPYGGLAKAVSAIEKRNPAFQKSLIASLSGPVGNVARVNQWASTLGRVELPEITKLYGKFPSVAAEVARLHDSVLKSLTGPIGADRARISAMLGLGRDFSAGLATTRFKMSAFAGVIDGLSTQSRVSNDAYRSLFGEWQTRVDLPESYWRDASVRRRMYDAAEVDPGLAGAGLKVAVEVVVESGLASGARSGADTVAVITLGDVAMTIRSNNARHDAYKVLEYFERDLRAYVTSKLSGTFGPDWFKLRVDGNVAGHAKRIRKQALGRGEAPMPLINYTELGHLASIIGGRKNWDEVFGDAFTEATEFDVDMQKLIAARRPTMHFRPMDSVRLVELICVVQRLSRQMENDGRWKLAAESEH